ncbi:hypothetical protein HDK64DRAFT_279735, partial [Phyllosticta capitalensis]
MAIPCCGTLPTHWQRLASTTILLLLCQRRREAEAGNRATGSHRPYEVASQDAGKGRKGRSLRPVARRGRLRLGHLDVCFT